MVHCDVEDEHLPYIARLTNLVELHLRDNRFRKMESLQALKQLEVLDISDGFCIYDDDIAALLGFTGWKIFGGNRLAFPKLRSIGLERTQVSDLACTLLGRIPTLRAVDLTRTRVADGGWAYLLELPLEEVGISDAVTDRTMRLLPPTVKHARLDGQEITTDGVIEFLDGHRGLEKLWFFIRRGTSAARVMPYIGRLTALKELDLIGDMNSGDLKFLGELVNAERMFISGNIFGHEWVPVLQNCPKLRGLSIAGIEFNNAAVPALKQLTQVQDLDLNCTYVSDQAVLELREALPGCKVWDIRARIGRGHAM